MATKTKPVVTDFAKAQAEQAAREANERLHAIRDAERYEENKGLAGKTFKTRDNYSCPEKPSDYWWLYSKVRKVDKDGMMSIFQFYTDKFGRIGIETRDFVYQMDGHRPISEAEFNKAWRALQQRVAETAPAAA